MRIFESLTRTNEVYPLTNTVAEGLFSRLIGGRFIGTSPTFDSVIDYISSYDEYLAKMIATTQHEYDPLSNYAITEVERIDRNTTEDSSTSANSSVHIYPYDSNSISEGVLDNKGNSSTTDNRDEVENTTRNTTHKGLTGSTYQNLIEAERNIIIDVTSYLMMAFEHVVMWGTCYSTEPMEV